MILYAEPIVKVIEMRIKEAIAHLKKRKPGLAFIQVGDNSASQTYVRMKQKKCAEVGILSFDYSFPQDVSLGTLMTKIKELNTNDAVDGILVQLPLPTHLSPSQIIRAVDPSKDIDGFHPVNMGKLLLGDNDGFIPCTPHGIQVLLTHYKIPIAGKHVVIVGRSNIVGKPLAALLMQKSASGNATVTIAHSMSRNLAEITRSADILIAAMGQKELITRSMVKEGSVVIDVGINRCTKTKKLAGDVAFEEVAPLCAAITPVPGGIGPMTVALLLSNTLLSYQRREVRN